MGNKLASRRFAVAPGADQFNDRKAAAFRTECVVHWTWKIHGLGYADKFADAAVGWCIAHQLSPHASTGITDEWWAVPTYKHCRTVERDA